YQELGTDINFPGTNRAGSVTNGQSRRRNTHSAANPHIEIGIVALDSAEPKHGHKGASWLGWKARLWTLSQNWRCSAISLSLPLPLRAGANGCNIPAECLIATSLREPLQLPDLHGRKLVRRDTPKGPHIRGKAFWRIRKAVAAAQTK
ncbi:MAG: hypothetical protein JWP08_301, partial [Bryobacterales bacterium]|nr:hypothetical protein [Bryobacterales bacterium]